MTSEPTESLPWWSLTKAQQKAELERAIRGLRDPLIFDFNISALIV
jgi:hypothetical protein